jgi:hypothetical protein
MNGIQKHSFVRKRDGRLEELKLDKIRTRIGNLCDGLNMDYINPVSSHFLKRSISNT